MPVKLNPVVVEQVLALMEQIPPGKVASYGQIARLIGRPQNSRLVAQIISQADLYGNYPCHRLVNHAGRLAPAWEEQEHLLWAEGVIFKPNGCVDMKTCQWEK
ncbi:MGMT family protein [Streptococcus oricebi]|uniref:Cysteine methyltransferase n=1 Tax=Streptococcus oricebi TaxID=1547447 RepID=A0ABS5B3K8_9STRE|nr:MGMT family protein [Streptococcus oricebi]MBP2623399.1 cysteine methyltransferase [Streptococcus oricebi]